MRTTIGLPFALLILAHALFGRAAEPTTAPAATQPADVFKLVTVFTILDEDELPVQLLRTDIYFIGNQAILPDELGLPRKIFWLDREAVSDNAGNYLTLKDLWKKAEDRRKDLLSVLPAMNDQHRAAVLKAMLKPELAVKEDGDKLSVSNQALVYDIVTEPISAVRARKIDLVNQLAALENWGHDSAPFANLAVAEELAKRSCCARQLKMQVVGERRVALLSRTAVVPFSAKDRERFAALLEAAKP